MADIPKDIEDCLTIDDNTFLKLSTKQQNAIIYKNQLSMMKSIRTNSFIIRIHSVLITVGTFVIVFMADKIFKK